MQVYDNVIVCVVRTRLLPCEHTASLHGHDSGETTVKIALLARQPLHGEHVEFLVLALNIMNVRLELVDKHLVPDRKHEAQTHTSIIIRVS